MGPIIILDKSSLQSLSNSKREIECLHKYYFINVTPVLIMEILGDLKKQGIPKEDYQKVQELASKILNMDMVINANYIQLLHGSIKGFEPVLDGRPNVAGGKQVVAPNGKKGVIYKQSDDEAALNRWKDGDFKTTEEMLAAKWRSASREIKYDSLLKIGNQMKSKYSSLQEIKTALDIMFEHPSSQATLLFMMGEEFGLNEVIRVKLMSRLGGDNEGRLLKNVAPYASYCLKLQMLFKLGIMNRLIGTRSTNRIDLEYLFYLPFCYVFSSNDKFHDEIVPLFLQPYQIYVPGNELKTDLHKLVGVTTANSSVTKRSPGPPDIEGSITVDLWKKHMKYPATTSDSTNQAKRMSPEAEKRIVENAHRLRKLADDPTNRFNETLLERDIDFIIKETHIGPREPCPCKSGKLFIDCHWDEVRKQ